MVAGRSVVSVVRSVAIASVFVMVAGRSVVSVIKPVAIASPFAALSRRVAMAAGWFVVSVI